MASHSYGRTYAASITTKIANLKVNQELYVSGDQKNVASKIQNAKRFMEDNVSFRTEAREGGRLIVRIS